jgi:hypothetical protein
VDTVSNAKKLFMFLNIGVQEIWNRAK